MLHEEPDDGWHRYVVFTVVTAALSTLTTALATWAVDELRAKYGSKKPEPVVTAADCAGPRAPPPPA